jgi:CBS-domain-containing membrane protein
VHHLPVVDADGSLCGMITPRDLLRALYGEVLACGGVNGVEAAGSG